MNTLPAAVACSGAGDVDQALSETDVLVMLLPATPETSRVLDAHRLAQLPASAYVLNVGRGSSVDEPALVDALQSGRLAGAALDVTSTEPLPSSSPLWQAPRLLITPHAAGGRPVGATTSSPPTSPPSCTARRCATRSIG